jgi:hypothetical protein
MREKLEKNGRLYSNKRRLVFTASDVKTKTCPTINFSNDSNRAKLKDDFSKGLRIKRAFAKLIFR